LILKLEQLNSPTKTSDGKLDQIVTLWKDGILSRPACESTSLIA